VFELDLSDRAQAEAFLMRRYEPALIEHALSRLPPEGGVVLDAGAHVGLVALQLAVLRRSEGTVVHALEPNPVSAGRLRRNLQLNPGASAELHELAVGEREGEVELAWQADARNLAGSHVAGPSEPDGAATGRVGMTTLDRFAASRGLERVDVLKLDVEGYELPALEGAAGLLAEGRVGCVLCELNDVYLAERGAARGDIVSRLERWGYRRVPIAPVGAQRLRARARRGGRAIEDAAFEQERRP
jgi:FkbM family methyltransferase